MKDKNVGYSEFLRAYKRNLVKNPNLICYKYIGHYWFYTQKMIWSIDILPFYEVALTQQIMKIGTLQEEKDR